jgi:hypothetical protein
MEARLFRIADRPHAAFASACGGRTRCFGRDLRLREGRRGGRHRRGLGMVMLRRGDTGRAGHRHGLGAGLALDGRGARGQPQAVGLSDDSITAYTTEPIGDLARGQALHPERPKRLNPFLCPIHGSSSDLVPNMG